MPRLSAQDKIELLKKARAAAQAVKEEIERQNQNEIDPDAVAQREPALQRAIIEIQDADEKVDDLEASQLSVQVDDSDLDRLTRLAADLDAKIASNALLNLGVESLTTVLNGVANVKSALG